MAYSNANRTGNKNKQQNEGPRAVYKLANQKLTLDSDKFLDKLWELFIEEHSVLAANMILRLAESLEKPQDASGQLRMMSLLARLTSEPARTPETVQQATEPAEAGNQPPSAEPAETAAPAVTEAATATSKTGPASEIGLAPASTNALQQQRSCRNPVHPGPAVEWTVPAAANNPPESVENTAADGHL